MLFYYTTLSVVRFYITSSTNTTNNQCGSTITTTNDVPPPSSTPFNDEDDATSQLAIVDYHHQHIRHRLSSPSPSSPSLSSLSSSRHHPHHHQHLFSCSVHHLIVVLPPLSLSLSSSPARPSWWSRWYVVMMAHCRIASSLHITPNRRATSSSMRSKHETRRDCGR